MHVAFRKTDAPVYLAGAASGFYRAAGQRAQLDRVEDMNFLALGLDQAVLLEAGKHRDTVSTARPR